MKTKCIFSIFSHFVNTLKFSFPHIQVSPLITFYTIPFSFEISTWMSPKQFISLMHYEVFQLLTPLYPGINSRNVLFHPTEHRYYVFYFGLNNKGSGADHKQYSRFQLVESIDSTVIWDIFQTRKFVDWEMFNCYMFRVIIISEEP